MLRFRITCLLGAVLITAGVTAQEAPLLTVLPRQEEARQLEVRGDLRMVRKSYLEAIEFYQQALRFSPRNPVLLNKTGVAYHHLFRLEEAKKNYERAAKADPDYAQAWNNLGTIYYARKNYKKAIRMYERALKANPAQGAIHSNLGTALFARKEYTKALEEFRLALLLDPEVFSHRSLFGVLLQEHSVQDRARYYFLLAKSFASLGMVDSCLLYLRRALDDGYPALEAQGEPAFMLIREDERFQELFAAPAAVLPQ